MLSRWIKHLGEGFLHLLYPPSCHICGSPAALPTERICPSCTAKLSGDLPPACPRCAATIGPHTATQQGCPSCRRDSFLFTYAIRFGLYDNLLRDVVLRMKSSSGELLAEILGRHWASQQKDLLLAYRPDLLIPVPLFWWRRWRRGYNQSEALAWGMAAALNLPCKPTWLRRIRNTPSQRTVSPSDRRQNLRAAFRVSPRAQIQEKTILLVDDVMTTGSTCQDASRALIDRGAREVIVAVLARAGHAK